MTVRIGTHSRSRFAAAVQLTAKRNALGHYSQGATEQEETV